MTDKVFSPGEVLTAADVNNYLLNKTGSGNAIINGAFEINQRNFTSTTTNTTYTFDRWITTVLGDGTTTYTPQTFSPGDVPAVGFPSANFLRIVTASQTAADVLSRIDQRIEDVRNFSGQTVTVSFYAKAATGTPKIAVEFGQSFGIGGSTAVNINAGQVVLGTSWTRHSLTVAIPSITGKTVGPASSLQLRMFVSAGTDFNARTGSLGIQSNTFDIWGVQVEAGSVATPFKRNANSLQGELAACQRYFVRLGARADQSGSPLSFGFAKSTTVATFKTQVPVPMRIQATSASFYSGTGFRVWDQVNAAPSTTSMAAVGNTADFFGNIQFDATVASGLTQYRPYTIIPADGVASFIDISAEL